MPECALPKKQSSKYAGVLNMPDIIHSLKSLYKVLSTS